MRKLPFVPLVCICTLAMAVTLPTMADVAPINYRVEPIVRNADKPQALVLGTEGRIFYLERSTGKVRVVQNGKLVADPVVTVSVPVDHEAGLLGIALHPNFSRNGWMYLYYTKAANAKNRIERYTVAGNAAIAGSAYVVVDDIGPAAGAGPWDDNGGSLIFGNDGSLYAGIGVMDNDALAQDPVSYMGKVLRIDFNADGSVQQVVIHAEGFRAPAGLAVNRSTGTIYATDHYDADDACDEVNVLQSGADYGWDIASCGDLNQQTPLATVAPQTGLAGLISYAGTKFPTPKVCANDSTKSCNIDFVCSNDPKKPCWSNKVCSNNSAKACTYTKVCSNQESWSCTTSAECSGGTCIDSCGTGNTCVPFCGTGNACVPACGWQVACTDSPSQPLFAVGQTNGTVMRDVVGGAAYDTLVSQDKFYAPADDPQAATNCPGAIKDVREGADGFLYTVSDDPAVSKAGVYRLLYEGTGGAASKPREVSGSPYFRMSLAKEGGGLKLWFEDLKKDVWGCSPGHCPSGSESTKYTVWSGPLVAPFAYGHTALVKTDGTKDGDALLTHTVPSMPTDSTYYLVSGRRANLEGSLGTRSDGVTERPGYAVTDICNTIGWGTQNNDLNKCTPDWPKAYPDQNNRMWKLSDFRGKVVVMQFGRYG